MSNGDFSGQTVLITGAGGALGRATASALAARGADLVLADMSSSKLAETARLCPGAKEVLVDVTDAEALVELAETARNAFDRPVTKLVATAGIFGARKDLIEVTEEEYDAMFNLNVRALWRSCKLFIPQMRLLGGGSIVLFSSTAGLVASRDVPLYSVTKAAVAMMTRALALNHAHENIRVNCVCPGTIASPMADDSIAFVDGAEAQAARRQKIVAAHPMGRLGEPAEVAAAVLYLLDDASGFTTGTALPIDGGRLA